MTWKERIANYEQATGFPQGLFIGGDGRVAGIWIMGHDYRVKSQYYGGYPPKGWRPGCQLVGLQRWQRIAASKPAICSLTSLRNLIGGNAIFQWRQARKSRWLLGMR